MADKKQYPKITISGDIGSGKSAVGRLLEEKTGFKFLSTGQIQRSIAKDRGMTTLELNKYAETHAEIDHDIDDFVKKLNQEPESLIIDSRMAWNFVPSAFKVYLTVDLEEAARRIINHQRSTELYNDIAAAKADILQRKDSEQNRFLKLYGVDCTDINNYDFVIDTSKDLPEQIVETILQQFAKWQAS